MDTCFRDRREAGQALAQKLRSYVGRDEVVFGVWRGGGFRGGDEISAWLGALFVFFVVRKRGVRGHGELARGAIASGEIRVVNKDVAQSEDHTSKPQSHV